MGRDHGPEAIRLGGGQQDAVPSKTVPDQGRTLRVDKAPCGGGVENGLQPCADIAEIPAAAVIGQARHDHRISGRSQDMGIEMALGVAGLKQGGRRGVDVPRIGEDHDRGRVGSVRAWRPQQPAGEPDAIGSGMFDRDDIAPFDRLKGGIDRQQGPRCMGLMKGEGRRTVRGTPPPQQRRIPRGGAENGVAVRPSGQAGHAKAFSRGQAP